MKLESCIVCNKGFFVKLSHKRRFKGPFCCSRLCRGELLRSAYLGKNNPNYKYDDNLKKFFVRRCLDLKLRANEKNLDFDLTPEFLYEIYKKQNGLCYYTGLPLKPNSTNFKLKGQADLDTLSIDRVEPEKGYTKTNIVMCCNAVNKLKGNAEPEELQIFLSALGLKSFGTCTVRCKRLDDSAKLPFRAMLGDGGYDLETTKIEDFEDKVIVHTGISCAPDAGWVLLLIPRSSTAKKGFRLDNTIGLIDSNFRGEITAVLKKENIKAKACIGDRLIQLVPLRIPFVEIQEVSDLCETDRGTGGWGSTGR